jgi:hypothetical protein
MCAQPPRLFLATSEGLPCVCLMETFPNRVHSCGPGRNGSSGKEILSDKKNKNQSLHLCSSYHVPASSCFPFINLLIPITPGVRHYYSLHCTDEKRVGERGTEICPRLPCRAMGARIEVHDFLPSFRSFFLSFISSFFSSFYSFLPPFLTPSLPSFLSFFGCIGI